MTETKATRTEKDSMGPMEVPADAYYGASTQRAVLNFPVSNLRYPPAFIHVLGMVKRAAAKANVETGRLDAAIGDVIVKAATEVVEGKFDDQFVIDIFQTGSGTSSNTNANEVIARRANEIMGDINGRSVHPNDHVNMGQSSNDVIPTASHLTVARAIKEELMPALEQLRSALQAKAEQWWDTIKTGRTHLQDATPIRLGQEFQGYTDQALLAHGRVESHIASLGQVALGGTAVGTGVNAHPKFSKLACAILTKDLGFPVVETAHHFQAQSALDAMLSASGAIRSAAVSMQKIANDIRWLGSGPRAGLGELDLPIVQPGSSIMPGTVNPVITESLLQVVAHIVGNDATMSAAAQGGFLELNTFWPVAFYNLHEATALLASATANFETQCIRGLQATSKGPEMVERGLMLATGLTPAIGYDLATVIAQEAAATGQTLREVAKAKTSLTDEQLNELLDPVRMTEPGIVEGAGGGG